MSDLGGNPKALFLMMLLGYYWYNTSFVYCRELTPGTATGSVATTVNKTHIIKSVYLMIYHQNETRHDKTCLRGFRPGRTQTGQVSS